MKKKSVKTKRLVIILIALVAVILVMVGYQLLSDRKSKDAYTIELDSGFGGDQTGFVGVMNESEFNAGVVSALQTLLNKDSHFIVLLSHPLDEAATNVEKVDKINEDNPDMVLSIHTGYNPNVNEGGMYIYADVPSENTNKDSVQLAQCIQQSFQETDLNPQVSYYYYHEIRPEVFTPNLVPVDDMTTYEDQTLDILSGTSAVAVYVEQLNIMNPQQITTWANEEGYQQLAQYYYEAIKAYYGVE